MGRAVSPHPYHHLAFSHNAPYGLPIKPAEPPKYPQKSLLKHMKKWMFNLYSKQACQILIFLCDFEGSLADCGYTADPGAMTSYLKVFPCLPRIVRRLQLEVAV